MKKLYIFVLKSYLGPLVMTFFISLFILVMQFLWKYVDDLVGKGLEWYLVVKLLFYASSTFVPLALPLAILLSSLMTFGNLGENYELVAIKAAGISLRKVMKPLVILTLFISMLAFYFSNNILPAANLKFTSLLYDIKQKKLAFNIQEGIFYNGMEGFTIRIGKKDKDGIGIHDVMIYNHTRKLGNIDVTTAKSGRMESTTDGRFIIFTLYDGYNYQEKVDQRDYRIRRPFERTRFEEEVRRFDLRSFEMNRTDEDLFRDHYRMLDVQQLSETIDSLKRKFQIKDSAFKAKFINNYNFYPKYDSTASFQADSLQKMDTGFLASFSESAHKRIIKFALDNARSVSNNIEFNKSILESDKKLIIRHRIEWHRKFTLSLACLVLFFVGAPLGAIIRKGGLGLPVVVSVLFFILFHITSITGEKYARELVLDVTSGMWISTAVLLPIGFFLTMKATSDSPLLDTDAWRKAILKILGKR
ncbi:MAG: LptF/LptG family permease [Bacteroidota bacterium]|nr:LptF/LptG family permease [Bacteroidota bacterium]